MKRIAGYSFAAISLLLCLAVAALWVRGRWVHDELTLNCDRHADKPYRLACIALASERGRIQIGFCYTARSMNSFHVGPGEWLSRNSWPSGPNAFGEDLSGWHWLGFYRVMIASFTVASVVDISHPNTIETFYGAPDWFVLVLLAIAPAIALRRIRARLLRGEGCCQICGYDLRATPDRCPECGTQAAATAR